MEEANYRLPQECRLYLVDVSELTQNLHLYRTFMNSLGQLTDDVLGGNEATGVGGLHEIAEDPRRRLYVLLAPLEGDGQPELVYVALEVYLEGDIPNMPSMELKECHSIKGCFPDSFGSWMFVRPVVGVHILRSFAYEDYEYVDFSVKSLVSYLNGEMNNEEVIPIPIFQAPRNEMTIHYVGVRFRPSLQQVLSWEKCEFFPLHVGGLMKKNGRRSKVKCTMIKVFEGFQTCMGKEDENSDFYTFLKQDGIPTIPIVAEDFPRAMFKKFVSALLGNQAAFSSMDLDLFCRLLKFNGEGLVGRPVSPNKLFGNHVWNLVETISHSPAAYYSSNLPNDFLLKVCKYHFKGKFNFELSTNEELALLRALQVGSFAQDAREQIRSLFDKLLHYNNTWEADVIDS